jgi:hypothetical protein
VALAFDTQAAALGAAFGGAGEAFVGGVPGEFGGGVLPPRLASGGAGGFVAISHTGARVSHSEQPNPPLARWRSIAACLVSRAVSL